MGLLYVFQAELKRIKAKLSNKLVNNTDFKETKLLFNKFCATKIDVFLLELRFIFDSM